MHVNITSGIRMITKQPPPVTIRPIFLSRHVLVNGMSILRDNIDFCAEMPVSFFQENPPLFMIFPFSLWFENYFIISI